MSFTIKKANRKSPTLNSTNCSKLKDTRSRKSRTYYTRFSPTQQIGGRAEGFMPFRHLVPLMSLDNSYNIEDLREFDERCRKLADGREFDYVAELKIDGFSVALHYENGVLIAGATRGDGFIGDDVLNNVKTIRTIPLKLKGDFPEKVEIRGEIFMARSVFRENQRRTRNAGRKNLCKSAQFRFRNTAAIGFAIVVKSRRLDMFPYDVLSGNQKAVCDALGKFRMAQKARI